MGTTIPAARAALYGKLVLAPLLVDKQTTFGPPDAYEESEVVALLGVVDPSEEDKALGRQNKDEVYILEVGCKVHDPAGDAADVDQRGFALAEAVADVVEGTANLTLGNGNEQGPVRTARLAYIRTDGALPAEGGGWVIFLRVGIRCEARIGRGG